MRQSTRVDLLDHPILGYCMLDNENPSSRSQETTMLDGNSLAYRLGPENQEAEATSTKRSIAALFVISVRTQQQFAR